MIRLMVVDDHELVRLGMRHILDDYPSIKIVGEAGDGETASANIIHFSFQPLTRPSSSEPITL